MSAGAAISRWVAATCLLAVVTSAAVAAGLDEGRFGKALDARRGSALLRPPPAWVEFPLTFECWVRLEKKSGYNVIVARDAKAAPGHWELFTAPRTGALCAYLPGRRPDHARTACDIVDGRWHHVGAVLETERIRLYVDGKEQCDQPLAGPVAQDPPQAFCIGSLVDGQLACGGWIDEARLSRGARPPAGLPDRAPEADASTLGLWRFDAMGDGHFADASPHGLRAQFVAATRAGPGPSIPKMSAAFQPLPPAEDTAPARAALRDIASRLALACVDPPAVRDAVLREWLYDFRWIGKLEHPESRRPWYPAAEADLERQAYDRHALIWPDDGGPAGTVIRRAEALADRLGYAGAARGDLGALRSALLASRPAAESPEALALYLAACAVRRQIALSNPLLDFDGILCVARGTFAGSVRSNPVTKDPQGGHFTTQYFGCTALPGGGLYVVRDWGKAPRVLDLTRNAVVQNGRMAGRRLDHGAFATPDLSYDGRSVVFAWTDNREHEWGFGTKSCFHLFRINADGTGLTQLTDGPYNDFDPCWLPDGRIAFVSERRGGHIRCFAGYLKVRTYTMFSMAADGTDIRPMSYFETSEWNPTVNNHGQVVFTRWDYTDRENCLGSRIWLCRPDGSDPRAPHGNYPQPYYSFPDRPRFEMVGGREIDGRMGTPLVEMGIRAIPDSPLYVFTAAPHHGEAFGSLCTLDLRIPDDGRMSQIRRITPEEPFPESENAGRRHYKYGSPWPLGEDFFVCNAWENLVLLDRYGNKELLCELTALPCAHDERLRLIDPIPLRPRRRPPVAAPERATRPATIAVMNVYDSDMPFPPGTKIKWLRVTQNILKSNHAMGEPMIGYERENTPRIPLGVVPVEEDGSAYFEAPVAKALIFQALDEHYRAVHSMRSVAFVRPGEQLTCQGCHEPVQRASALAGTPLALRRAPSPIAPEAGPVEPVSYHRQIRPIFERSCVPCHAEKQRGPRDMGYEALKEEYTFWFSGAMFRNMASDYSGVHGGSRTIPGRFGARHSRIGRALFDENHRASVSETDRHKIVLWLDSNSLRLGAYVREEAQLRGELVWPELDVDPENVVGTEFRGAPMKGNFWHENLWGPRAILATSHQLKKVFLLDEGGEVAWDYHAPNPQDAWMLPDGNVLTTHLHGVQEVTRDRKVVWEYRVRAPDEVPTCQPLPDGNVLIGIVGQCRLIEVNRRGDVTFELPLSTTEKRPHAQFRMCRKTPQGTYLVPFTAEGAVREYARDGSILREFPRKPTPVCAIRLEDGNTLISAGRSVTEYDPHGNVVWELAPEDIPDINVAVPAGIQRLPNGNTVVCNWGTKTEGDRLGAHIFEVAPDKRVVWHVAGTNFGQVAQCQLLAPGFRPRNDAVVR